MRKWYEQDWLNVAYACTVAASLVLLSAAFVLLNMPQFGPATITYPTEAAPSSRRVELPYTDDANGVNTFTAQISVRLAPLSSTVIQIAPDECIEEYSIDGGKLHNLRETDHRRRCWPNSYPVDVASEGKAGTHAVQLVVTNKTGPRGAPTTLVDETKR